MNYKTIGLFLVSLFFLPVSVSAAGAASQHITEEQILMALFAADNDFIIRAITQGFSPNFQDQSGVSLVMYAVIRVNVPLLEYFVNLEDQHSRRIVDFELCDKLGNKVFYYAENLKEDTQEEAEKKAKIIEILRTLNSRRIVRAPSSFDGSFENFPEFESVQSLQGSAAQSPIQERRTPH